MSRVVRFDNRLMLLQAYDILGAHLFGDNWSGKEPWTREHASPEETKQKRQAIVDEILEKKARLQPLLDKFQYADREDQNELSAQMSPLQKEIGEKENELHRLPNSYDTLHVAYEAYQRREKVHNLIWDAAADGAIQLIVGQFVVMDIVQWSREPDFELLPIMSQVNGPQKYHGSKRDPVSVDREKFLHWVSQQPPITPSAATRIEPTLEAKASAFLNQLIAEHPTLRKDVFWEKVKARFPNLSGNAFKVIWRKNAPESMKRGGRRHGS